MNRSKIKFLINEILQNEFIREAKSTPGNPNVFWLITSLNDASDKNYKELSSGTLNGISGISDNNRILMHWLGMGRRNVVIVMNAKSTLSANKGNLKRIEYDNAEQLTSNNMAMLRRIYDVRPGDNGNSKIINNVFRDIYSLALTSNDNGIKRLGWAMRDGNISQYDVNERYKNGELEINSPKELAKYFWGEISKNTTSEEILSIDPKMFEDLVRFSITKGVHTYSSEGEWIVNTPSLVIPPGSKLLVAVETPLENFPKEAQEKLKNGQSPRVGEEIPANLPTMGMRSSIPIIKSVFAHKLDKRYDVRFIDINKFKEIQIKLQVKHTYG